MTTDSTKKLAFKCRTSLIIALIDSLFGIEDAKYIQLDALIQPDNSTILVPNIPTYFIREGMISLDLKSIGYNAFYVKDDAIHTTLKDGSNNPVEIAIPTNLILSVASADSEGNLIWGERLQTFIPRREKTKLHLV